MPTPPRAISFIDGQNLFNSAKAAFGYQFPNYDVQALSQAICEQQGWQLEQVRFYTGMPSSQFRPQQHAFWTSKLRVMGNKGIWTFTRDVKYKQKDGQWRGREKGIDVRLAIDIIRLAFDQRYDVALVFSQDQDFVEAAEAIRVIAKAQNRFIKIASAFPRNPSVQHLNRGINKTDWLPFDKALYDACLDPRDYRPKRT